MKNKQHGISFIGILFIGGIIAFTGAIAAQAIPTLIEFQVIQKAVNKAKDANTVLEVRKIFDQAALVDDIKSITGKNLEIVKQGEKTVISFAYNKEIHLGGLAYLLLKYTGQSQ